MALLVLSDPHLSLSVEKPMDVFGGAWMHWEEKIRENWLRTVRETDAVVIPGDISWGMNFSEAEADLAFLNALPGEKYLMKGNHDYWWNSLKKMNEWKEAMGWTSLHFLYNDAVATQGAILCGSRGWLCEDRMTAEDEKILLREAGRFRLSLEKALFLAKEEEEKSGKRQEIIVFSHYPILSPSVRKNPILEVLKEYEVRRVYYGHLHHWGTKPLLEEEAGIRFTLVSADHCGMCPVPIEIE